MKKLLFFAVCLLFWFAPPARAANLYVRPNGSGYGTGNGTDWSNAFNGFSGIAWAAIRPGDTLWVAGGTYTQILHIGASGSAGNPITINRVLKTDAVPTSAAGWNSAYDSQVVINTPVSTSLIFIDNGVGSYVAIDGRVDSGIYLPYKDGGSGVELNGSADFTNITVKHLEAAGPGPITQTSDTRGFDFTTQGTISNITVSHCSAHNSDTLMQFTRSVNLVVEYCDLHDAGAVNAATYHPNTIYVGTANNATIRYNQLHNIDVEGIFFGDSGNNGVKIYGNVFYQGTSAPNSGRGIEIDNAGDAMSFQIYNNVFANLPLAPIRMSGVGSSGSVTNNIFWNSGGVTYQNLTHDYNLSSDATAGGEAHGLANAANPFVNSTGNGDFHLKAGSNAINKGTALAVEFNQDIDSHTRGADGTWDIGAYEYTSGAPGNRCDLNNDGAPNALDLQLLANEILKTNPSISFDINKDGSVNAIDLQTLANVILGKGVCP